MKNILKDIEGIENALVERERIIPNALENYISIEEFSNNINELKKIYLISDDLGDSSEAEKYYFRFRTLK